MKSMWVRLKKSEDDARNERGEERCGGIRVGLLLVARAERLADVRARTHADHEGNGLNDRHGGEDNAYRAGGGGADLADEECVGHVVDVGDEHGDDRRHGHLRMTLLTGSQSSMWLRCSAVMDFIA